MAAALGARSPAISQWSVVLTEPSSDLRTDNDFLLVLVHYTVGGEKVISLSLYLLWRWQYSYTPSTALHKSVLCLCFYKAFCHLLGNRLEFWREISHIHFLCVCRHFNFITFNCDEVIELFEWPHSHLSPSQNSLFVERKRKTNRLCTETQQNIVIRTT